MKKIGLERQRYSEEIKLGVLKKLSEGSLSAVEACIEYGISRTTMYRWVNELSNKKDNLERQTSTAVLKNEEEKLDSELLKQKIISLEKSLEYEKLRSEAYEKMIEIAEKEFSIQIGKKSGAKQLKK